MPEPAARRLLVVDDEVPITEALRRFLRKKYRVFTAQSGMEALELLARHSIPVVISDMRMPGMTGEEFLSLAEQYYPDTVRILASGSVDIQGVEAVGSYHIYRFVAKPWDLEELQDILAQAYEQYDSATRERGLSDQC